MVIKKLVTLSFSFILLILGVIFPISFLHADTLVRGSLSGDSARVSDRLLLVSQDTILKIQGLFSLEDLSAQNTRQRTALSAGDKTVLRVKKDGLLQVGSLADSVFGELRVTKNTALHLESGAVLRIAPGSQVIIEPGGELQLAADATVEMSAPQAFVIERGVTACIEKPGFVEDDYTIISPGIIDKDPCIIQPPPPPIIIPPSEETAKAPRDSFYVNQLQGMATISESGAVLYQIPLLMPVGTAGVQPQLSLLYNSQGGEGTLGRGFSLTGLSSIARTGKDFYHDNVKTGVQLTWGDQFVLDGQRLIRTAGSAEVGNNGLLYDTENAAFASIESFGNGAAYLGPQYFTVRAKDGSTIHYGNSSDSRAEFNTNTPLSKVVAEYFIQKQTDPNGNYITYQYYNEGGAVYIKEIRYTGNDLSRLSPYHKIVFVYEARPKPQAYYMGNHKVNIDKRLKEINIYAQESLIYSYTLHYLNTQNRMAFIRLYDASQLLLGELNFLWQEGENRFESSTRLTSSFGHNSSSGGWSNGAQLRQLADVDGDGKSDIVGFGEYDVSVALARNAFSSTLAYNQGFTKIRGGWNENYSRFVQDVNGDGLADIVGFGEYGVDVALSNGSSFEPSTQWSDQYGGKDGWNNPSKYPRHLADVNGDGLVDIIAMGQNGTSVSLNTGSSFAGGMPLYYFFGRDQAFRYDEGAESYVADINGDGRADVIGFRRQDSDCSIWGKCKKRQYALMYALSNGNSFGPAINSVKTVVMDKEGNQHKKFFQDMNGDGKADFIYSSEKVVFVALFKGDGFEEPARWLDNSILTLSYLADVNHDGLPDVIGYGNGSMYVSLNTGKAFAYPVLWNSNSIWNQLTIDDHTPSDAQHNFRTIGDANGDGQADLIGFNGDGVYLSACLSKAPLLASIQDNTGTLYSFTYDYLSNPLCFQKGVKQSYPLLSFQGAFSVCRTLNSRIHQKTFQYEGALLHCKGRGFLGFLKRVEDDAKLGIRQVIQQSIDTKYLQLLPLRKESYATHGELTLLARNESQWAFRDLGSLRFTLQTNSNTAYDASTQSSRYTTTAYDAHGNVELHKETAGNAESLTQYTYTASAGRTIPNRVASMTSTSRFVSSSQALATTTLYQYNAYGNLLRKTDRAATPLANTTAYTYSSYGLPLSIQISATGLAARTTTLGYDALYRFNTHKTDFLGTSSETFDAMGRRLTAIGIDGHTATYTYNRYGQLEWVHYPNGQITFTARRNLWNDPPYAYFLIEHSSGSPYLKTYYNRQDQVLKSETVNPSGVLVSKFEYDAQGRRTMESVPDFVGSTAPMQYIAYTYDRFGRVTQEAQNLNLGNGSVVRRTTTQYNGLTTTVTLPSGQTRSQTLHPAGFVLTATDAGGSVSYSYEIPGLPSSVTAPGGALTTFTYDAAGRKTSITDPNAGTIEYTYNTFDEILTQKDARGYTTTHTYDSYGRLLTKAKGANRILTYTYVGSGRNIGKIQSIVSNQQTAHHFTYDDYGQITRFDDVCQGETLSSYNTYNALGQIIRHQFPSGYQLSYTYDNYGFQKSIRETQGNALVWQLNSVDYMGKELQSTVVGNRSKTQLYNAFGQALSMSLTGLMSYSYHYDILTDNMTSRQNSFNAQNESFTYDNLNRLTTGLSYHPNGNIATKQGVGNYSYHSSKKHALTQVSMDIERGLDHQITYSATGKVLSIQSTEGSSPSFEFLYGPDDQRRRVDVQLPTHNVVRHYSQDYERTTIYNTNGSLPSQQTKEYIYSPYGLVAIRNNGNLQAVAVDHLGSIVAEYNPRKSAYEFFGYDAWGRRYRKDSPQSLYYFDEHLSESTNPTAFNDFYSRGYTGHEHLDAFGLINMNGRLYDPIVGRMLSPDPYVSDGGYTQDFNRYSYARNNPLSYVDPTGEIVWFVPVIIGAAVGAISGALIGNSNGATGWEMAGYIAGGGLIGGLSGGVAAGVGALGGAAWWAGAAAGAIGGAGFSGLASDWNSEAMLKGATFGALSGFIGGGVASSIGSDLGAAVGGATSNLTNQILHNGGFKNINWLSVGLAAAMSYGMHQGMQYLQYNLMGGTVGEQKITYKQFSKINTAYQLSRFWRREYGVVYSRNGSPRMFRGSKFRIDMNLRIGKGEFYSAHTHWAKEGIDLGDGYVIVGGHHSKQDLSIPGYSTVIGRATSTYLINVEQGYQTINPDPFMRFFLFQVLNLKKR